MKNPATGVLGPAERVSDLAHELRSPLGGIESMIALLAQTQARSDQDVLIAGLQSAAAHLRNVANAMLKPDGLAGEATPAAEALRFFAVSARSRAQAAGRAFRAEVAAECAGHVVANGTAFRQMLENLIDNAIRHGAGDVTLRAALSGEDCIKVAVIDSGDALVPALGAGTFERGVTNGDGDGLGLAIVAGLASRHGGACGVSARDDGQQGLCVWFTMPVSPLAAPATGEIAHADPVAPVLVVDDDPMSQLLMKTVLGHLGLPCETVASPAEALVLMQDRVFAAVFTDMTMPGMSGWDFIAQLRAQGVEIPLVGVSGRVEPEDKARAREAGASWMIDKPATIHDLRQALVAIGLRDPMLRQTRAA